MIIIALILFYCIIFILTIGLCKAAGKEEKLKDEDITKR